MSDGSLDTLQLETSRLILRVPHLSDLDAFAALMADQEAARFIGGVAPREVTWRALMTMIGAWHATGVSMFSVFEQATGRWVGRLGPWQPEGWPGAEVGWAIVRDCWGRGYAPEGAAAAMDRHHSLHRAGQRPIAAGRAQAWLAESRTRATAAAVRGRSRGHLGSDPRGVARAGEGMMALVDDLSRE